MATQKAPRDTDPKAHYVALGYKLGVSVIRSEDTTGTDAQLSQEQR